LAGIVIIKIVSAIRVTSALVVGLPELIQKERT